ncbi:MAG: MerR family transcriptional regulator, partial [Tissierella sp.]|nr:MerR family transcriptional regulator [Tissierella sp.]
MEYSISKLARISGVTTRTLRYYDEIGLLKPKRISSNGYRIYGENQVNLLQQILFYKELGIGLEDIDNILNSSDYNIEKSLQEHLIHLNQEKIRIELLIKNVNKTISSLKGETIMSDKEKFEGFKNDLIKKNEEQYGLEIRDKYG